MHKICNCNQSKYLELKNKLIQIYLNLIILDVPRHKSGKNYSGLDKSRFNPKGCCNIPTIEIYVDSDDLLNNPCHKIATLAHEFGHYQSHINNNYQLRDKNIIEEIRAWRLGFKFLVSENIDIYHLIYFSVKSICTHIKGKFCNGR